VTWSGVCPRTLWLSKIATQLVQRIKHEWNLVGLIASNVDSGGGRSTAPCARRPQSLQAIVAWVAIPALILATAGCSLRQEHDATSPIASAERTPISVIETAFVALNDAVIQTKAHASCNDFESSFLNSNCLSMHKKVRLRNHRVATSVIGQPDAIPSKANTAAHSSSVTKGEGLQANHESPPQRSAKGQYKVGSGRREDSTIRCAKAGLATLRCN
jgi:hypothetical protein